MDLFTAVEISTNETRTENGCLTNKSSLNKCLDLFAMGGSYRKRSLFDIQELIRKAYNEDRETCVAILFYLRDIRNGGQGEKKIFREGIKYLRKLFNTEALIESIVEVGSWKDVFEIFSVDEYAPVVKNIYENHIKNDSYDLMEKWLPSIGGSKNKEAEKLASYLGLSPRNYRKYLSKARATLNLVESKMCANEWGEIDYSKVPSKANLLYKNAFKNHDGERYSAFINNVLKASCEVDNLKINAKTLLPYEIVSKYIEDNESWFNPEAGELDLTLEALWNNLLDFSNNQNNIVVADVSGSMLGTPMAVSISLAIYYAQRNKGIFKDKFITFSGEPSFVDIKGTNSLKEAVDIALHSEWGYNTDIQKVFEVLLSAAKNNNVPEEEMPKCIYIISDMEFDTCVNGGNSMKMFDAMRALYEEAGYELPKVVFWNVDARNNNLPVTFSETGVALVSGASPSIFTLATSEDINPIKIMGAAIEKFRKYTKILK